jgi:hypothetical protein
MTRLAKDISILIECEFISRGYHLIFIPSWRFIRMRGFEMMACGFLLLTWTDTYRLWSNCYFWLHFICIGIIALNAAGVLKQPEGPVPKRTLSEYADPQRPHVD